MVYRFELRTKLDKKFAKLSKKNYKQLEIIYKKIEEIIQNPHRYKNLRSPLNHWKRVHIDNHFVLTFSIIEEKKLIIIEEYEHHNLIYK